MHTESAQLCEYLPTNTLIVNKNSTVRTVKIHANGHKQTYFNNKQKQVAFCFNVDTGSIECPTTRGKMLKGEHKEAFMKAERAELDGP